MVVRKIFAIFKYRKLIITSILGASGYNYVHNHNFFPYLDQIKRFKERFDLANFELIGNKFLANINENINKSKGWMDWFLAYEPMQLGYQQDAMLVTQNNLQKGVSLNNTSLQDEIFEYLKKIENLEKENKELRKQILIKQKGYKIRKLEPTLIDLYSEILDDLNEMDADFQMPRVVVVGDQSSGKTSVLEMIAQSHIFPRGSGEMMTRSPIKVTMSQGPQHVANFNNEERLFDLSKEKDLTSLRREIELRMIRSLNKSVSISNEVISLTVKGPGLPRMILVDLPGIISTVTTEMAPDTRDKITKLVKTYMTNPNSIIMCIQDGSIDAERSNITDIVNSIDPHGARTIFVLTKVDVAEQNSFNPDRLRKILDGKLFPMKALGYFAVITGTGNVDDSIEAIKMYEEEFFRNSELMKRGVFRPSQVTTTNMSLAVSKLFWKIVRSSIEQQFDELKAERFNLETEWKSSYGKYRELDREELYERGKTRVLDDFSRLSTQHTPKQWEDQLLHSLWLKINLDLIDGIYLDSQISKFAATHDPNVSGKKVRKHDGTALEIALKKWSESTLPSKTIEAGWDTIKTNLAKYFEMEDTPKSNQADPSRGDSTSLYKTFRDSVLSETLIKHEWNVPGLKAIQNLQSNSLFDPQPIHDKSQWDQAVKFAERALQETLESIDKSLKSFETPSWFARWFTSSNSTQPNSVQASKARAIQTLPPEFKNKILPAFREEFTRILKYYLSTSTRIHQLQTGSEHATTAAADLNSLIDQAKTSLMIRGYDFPNSRFAPSPTPKPSNNGASMTISSEPELEGVAMLNTPYDVVLHDLAKNIFRKEIFASSLQNIRECRKAYAYFDQLSSSSTESTDYSIPNLTSRSDSENNTENRRSLQPPIRREQPKISNIRCDDVIFFWRIYSMLQITARALRQQIAGSELKALNSEIREIVEEFGSDPTVLQKLFTGRQVTLAEELKKIRSIQEKLDKFVQKLSKEKQ